MKIREDRECVKREKKVNIFLGKVFGKKDIHVVVKKCYFFKRKNKNRRTCWRKKKRSKRYMHIYI